MMSKLLILTLHRKDRSPGQRYRHEQFLAFFERKGFEITISNMLNESQDRVFYGRGNILSKIKIGMNCIWKRWKDVQRASQFDYIFIFRDAFFFGTYFESRFSKAGAKLIYDFDDAIWLMDKNPNQGIFNYLKYPNKTAKIIAMADEVIVGNHYLKEYAIKFNRNAHIIPSTIDLDKYAGVAKKEKEKICIGWTGSFSTIKHFETIVPALEEVKSKFSELIYFKLIGDSSYMNDDLSIVGEEWKSETEAEDLNELDIGIMPLPDNEWTKGKCAMKGLQYMALGIPTIMSPVGVNSDIIQDGVNGMLAGSVDDWVGKLSMLIEDEGLRKRIGQAGRETVVRDYSVEANEEKWLEVFQ